LIAVSGQVQHFHIWQALADPPGQIVAVHLRHPHVGQKQIERAKRLRHVERFCPTRGRGCGVADLAQSPFSEQADPRLVVDD
jgi:hypothetical protein